MNEKTHDRLETAAAAMAEALEPRRMLAGIETGMFGGMDAAIRGNDVGEGVGTGAIAGILGQTGVGLVVAAALRSGDEADRGSGFAVSFLGGLMRVAYILTAAMPGVLPRAPLLVEDGRITLEVPQALEGLCGDRLNSRMRSLGRLIGREPLVRILPSRMAAE